MRGPHPGHWRPATAARQPLHCERQSADQTRHAARSIGLVPQLLARRSRRILDAAKLETTRAERELLSIQTFHSFFWSILKVHAYLLGAPAKLSILLPQDEKALSGGINDEDAGWGDWLIERERLFREEGRIAFDLFAPYATELLATSSHLLTAAGPTAPHHHRGRSTGHRAVRVAVHPDACAQQPSLVPGRP